MAVEILRCIIRKPCHWSIKYRRISFLLFFFATNAEGSSIVIASEKVTSSYHRRMSLI
ncbi:uncharacterized protein B0P05DRAFT_500373 [Gilbertella persicaria]|uniref:uncharacterized protein n=1 Tax=Gilbertella persicaria TaxID=101096 RepID=UPI00221ED34A|nr:uncharacterized protein B0P05DRAFT_500373 [Gilbertella persicaria]KAI8048586.1 hypothetical protein B0P05DRAFT_500373 [Gilbertella persicaria]